MDFGEVRERSSKYQETVSVSKAVEDFDEPYGECWVEG